MEVKVVYHNHSRRTIKQVAKYYTKKILRAALKKFAVTIMALLAPLAPLLLGLLVAVIFIAAVYSVMPQNWHLAGTEPTERDLKIKQGAETCVAEDNIKETWLIHLDGRKERLNCLVDRYGHDTEIANKWGDIYSPVLYRAATQVGDKLSQSAWVEQEIKQTSYDLRPYYYYKQSTVTYCGDDGCDSVTVFLLTEADTIRGHYTYEYEWITESHGGGSVTYERFVDKKPVGDNRWERLENHLKPYLRLTTPQDVRSTRQMVFEAGEGFTSKQEWVAWLFRNHQPMAWASRAMVSAGLTDFYREAGERYDIPWWFLAAIGETAERQGFPLPEGWEQTAAALGFDPIREKDNPKTRILIGSYLLSQSLGAVNWQGDWQTAMRPALARYKLLAETPRIEQLAAALRDNPSFWPVPGYYIISSHFGSRRHPITGRWHHHTGIDIPAPPKAPVVAVSGGVAQVVPTGNSGGYGNLVIVTDARHEYYYAHLSAISVSSGQLVRPGDQLGWVGSTGVSTGPHLHFGVKSLGGLMFLDPMLILRS